MSYTTTIFDDIPDDVVRKFTLKYLVEYIDRANLASVDRRRHDANLMGSPPEGHATWQAYISWFRMRHDEARMPVAAGDSSSLYLTAGGHLISYFGEHVDRGRWARSDTTGVDHRPAHILEGMRFRFRCIYTKSTFEYADPGGYEGTKQPAPHFTVAVSYGGEVYTWGEGTDGQLGHNNTITDTFPKRVQALTGHRVLSVAAGFAHCLAVTERGAVFSWGNDQSGQCGNGSSQYAPRLRPGLILHDVRARSASAGTHHSLVVTEDGIVWAFGDYKFRRYRELDRDGNQVPYNEDDPYDGDDPYDPCGPVVVQIAVRIRSVAAGESHALAITETGEVFAWGKNFYGELGLGFRTDQFGVWGTEWEGDTDASFQYGYSPVTVPKQINLDGEEAIAVTAGSNASCAVTRSGILFTWGSKSSYFPANKDVEPAHAVPYRVTELKDVVAVSMAGSNSHTLAITRDGVVYGWGSVEELHFGTGVAATSVHAATATVPTATVYEYTVTTSPRPGSTTRLQTMWQFMQYFI